jgi:DNA-binding response OmpR family regulator
MDSVGSPAARTLTLGRLEIRPADLGVLLDGELVRLTPRELALIAVLAEHEGRVVERHVIYESVWGDRMPYRDRSVDVLVRKLRAKLEAARPGVDVIQTRYGVGYRLDTGG